jgi:hypothetical protein
MTEPSRRNVDADPPQAVACRSRRVGRMPCWSGRAGEDCVPGVLLRCIRGSTAGPREWSRKAAAPLAARARQAWGRRPVRLRRRPPSGDPRLPGRRIDRPAGTPPANAGGTPSRSTAERSGRRAHEQHAHDGGRRARPPIGPPDRRYRGAAGAAGGVGRSRRRCVRWRTLRWRTVSWCVDLGNAGQRRPARQPPVRWGGRRDGLVHPVH